MSLSPIISRDIVNTRLLLNAIKREKYMDTLRDAVVGDYKWSAYNTDYNGWLKCDGRQLSKTTYSALYAILGNTYGTNGGNFYLPNCQGRLLAAAGTPTGGSIQPGASNLVLGTSFGSQTHTLSVSEMPSHTHTGTTNEYVDTPESENVALTGIGTAVVSGSTQRHLTFTTDPRGSTLPHDIQNPTIVIGNVFLYSGVLEPYVPPVDIIGPNDNTYNA